MKLVLGPFDAASALAGATHLGRGAAQQVDHGPAHAQLGIGGEPVLAGPFVLLGALGQRQQAGLHQVLDVERGASAAGQVPGQLAHHRHEARHPSGNVPAVSLCGVKVGMILNHAAKASLSNSGCPTSGEAGAGCASSASPPTTAITSIGCAAGNSLIEITRQPGARSLSSAAIGRRARGWTTSAGGFSPGSRAATIAAIRSPSERARSGSMTTCPVDGSCIP